MWGFTKYYANENGNKLINNHNNKRTKRRIRIKELYEVSREHRGRGGMGLVHRG